MDNRHTWPDEIRPGDMFINQGLRKSLIISTSLNACIYCIMIQGFPDRGDKVWIVPIWNAENLQEVKGCLLPGFKYVGNIGRALGTLTEKLLEES